MKNLDGAKKELEKYGYCPIMSTSHCVVSKVPAGILQQESQGVQIVNAAAPCLGPKCQLWDEVAARCSIVAIAECLRSRE